MAKFTWQDGTLVSKAKVEIDGTIYEVDPEEYSGATPLSASNLNTMQDGIYEDIGDKSNLETSDKTNLVSAINSILPVVLFEDDNGIRDNATVNLSDSASNYSYIEIYFGLNTNEQGINCVKVYNPDGKYANVVSIKPYNNEIQLKTRVYYINGNTITTVNKKNATIGSSVSIWDDTLFNIYKVVGYK